jgi:hypothetical protein
LAALRWPSSPDRDGVKALLEYFQYFGPEGTWQSTDVHKKAAGQTAVELIRDPDQRSKSDLT